MLKLIFGHIGVYLSVVVVGLNMALFSSLGAGLTTYLIVGVICLVFSFLYFMIIIKTADRANSYNDPQIATSDTVGDMVSFGYSIVLICVWVHIGLTYDINDLIFYIEQLLFLIGFMILTGVELRRTAWLAYKRFGLLDKSQILNLDGGGS